MTELLLVARRMFPAIAMFLLPVLTITLFTEGTVQWASTQWKDLLVVPGVVVLIGGHLARLGPCRVRGSAGVRTLGDPLPSPQGNHRMKKRWIGSALAAVTLVLLLVGLYLWAFQS